MNGIQGEVAAFSLIGTGLAIIVLFLIVKYGVQAGIEAAEKKRKRS